VPPNFDPIYFWADNRIPRARKIEIFCSLLGVIASISGEMPRKFFQVQIGNQRTHIRSIAITIITLDIPPRKLPSSGFQTEV
jgi:hypothetical protein